MRDKFLWRFHRSFGRMGHLEGIFVATLSEINQSIGKQVYFGEVLGKHSEIYFKVEETDFKRLDDVSVGAIEEVSKVLGTTWSGRNPLKRLKEQAEEGHEDIE